MGQSTEKKEITPSCRAIRCAPGKIDQRETRVCVLEMGFSFFAAGAVCLNTFKFKFD